MARQFARWSRIPFIGLRFSAIREPEEYESFPDSWRDPHAGEWNLWGYVDARDVAQACRLSLTAPVNEAAVFMIAAGDTASDRPSAELLAECFPSVRLAKPIAEHETLLSIDKARRVLGYDPGYSWRDALAVHAGVASPHVGRR
jgi:nucleoside-diphosphate-sugar epimerase